MKDIGFKLYLLFIISWFLHLPARIPTLGVARFDLLLVAATALFLILGREKEKAQVDEGNTSRLLQVLLVYSVVTIPFVEWPGSVLRRGIENFVKALLFFYFTKNLVTSEKKLKFFVFVFLGCQFVRIAEPLYLHMTEGYWGETAYMSGESLDRLKGAPYDVIGANGLAFVVLTVLPFIYFLRNAAKGAIVMLLIGTPVLLYTLSLTGSRSGLLGLFAVGIGILLKSRKKVLLAVIMALVLIIGFGGLSLERKDRFRSIFDSEAKNASTFKGRIEGVKEDFKVALRRPFFGHGLGTSIEANYNIRGSTLIAHNLYVEVAQELGFGGLLIFLLLIKSIISNFIMAQKEIKGREGKIKYLFDFKNAMQVWLGMNILFSFASYGLSSYEWYLFGGLSVVLRKLIKERGKISPDV